MKILRRAQRNISILGINPRQGLKNHPFNCRNVLALVVLILSTILCGMHLFRLANTFIEYTHSMYAFSSLFFSTSIVLIVLFKMPLLFKSLTEMETAIDERKHKSFCAIQNFWRQYQSQTMRQ